MRNKPFSTREKACILKVSKVVAEALGLAHLSWTYQFLDEQVGTVWAETYTMKRGWVGHIRFYPLFFTLSFKDQLETIVHEHIHVAFHPNDQATHQAIDDFVAAREVDRCEEIISQGREIAVTCLATPLLKLLMPKIKKVL